MPTESNPDGKSPERVIKKYPNRRLYDTKTSSYITLADIKQLVMHSEAFVVRDAKSGDNLTRAMLLQIILDEEANGSPMFTAPVLANIIRFYGHAMQGFMGGYLEQNIRLLMKLQQPMMQGGISNHLFTQMQEHLQRQTEQFLANFGIKRSG